MYNLCLILTGNIQNYDKVCLLCNKIEFAVFNIEKEIVKARQLVKEQELHTQETLNFCKSFLENVDNASLAKSQNSTFDQFLKHQNFMEKNSKKCH